MTTRDVKCSVFHTNEKQEKPAAASNIEIKLLKSCCQRMVFLPNCARLLFPHFFIPSLISNNAVSSDYPNASQAPFVANQRTNHLLISQSFLNDHCPALSKWMTSWLSGQPTKPPRLERWAIASHRLTDGGQPFGGTQKPSENHRTRWLPPTIPFNGDGCFENHRKNAMVR